MSDFTNPETFTPAEGLAKANLTPLLIMGVPLALVSWLLFALILYALKVPASNWVALPVAIAFAAGMIWLRYRSMAKQVDDIRLVADPSGLTYHGEQQIRHIAWDGLREARFVPATKGIDAKRAQRERLGTGFGSDSAAVGLGQAGINATGSVASHLSGALGVVGLGTVEFTPQAGALAKETFRQNQGRFGVDPQTGQPYLPIPLSQFDLDWPNTRIGAWLAQYRPDLAESARQQRAQQMSDADKPMMQFIKDTWREEKAKAAETQNPDQPPQA